MRNLPFGYGSPVASGTIRERLEDFQVEELLPFPLAGEGEHAYLQIRKQGTNTDWLARRLARFCGMPASAVSYAGLKDRHAVTTQWFSVHLGNRPEPEWARFNCDEWEILLSTRHTRKLRRGANAGNRFRLRVTDVRATGDLSARLEQVAAGGVPNLYGEQRFGRDNIANAERWAAGELRVKSRQERGIYLSSLRSAIFNGVLARRVPAGDWNRILDGDVMILDGSHSYFRATGDESDQERVGCGDIHPSGPLWGRGDLISDGVVGRLERESVAGHEYWCQVLEQAGLTQERRALRVMVRGLVWCFDSGAETLALSFHLPAGAYATAVLREIVDYHDAARAPDSSPGPCP